jgi:hypothetical protein
MAQGKSMARQGQNWQANLKNIVIRNKFGRIAQGKDCNKKNTKLSGNKL